MNVCNTTIEKLISPFAIFWNLIKNKSNEFKVLSLYLNTQLAKLFS